MKEWDREVSMGVTLRRSVVIRFSETAVLRFAARARPGHDDTCGHVARGARAGAPGGAVGARGHPDHAAEGPAEAAQAREPDVEADLRDRLLGLAQQRHRALEPASLQVAVRRLAERLLEGADEVRLRGQRDARERRDVEGLV